MLVAFLVIITIAMVGLSLTFSGKSARHISLREMIKYEKKK
jgi:hypothetical protein